MVMPGSLDYLYYNGVLDHIPYYAYDSIPYNQSQMANPYSTMGNMYSQPTMNANQYLNTAMQGNGYNTYNHPDVFVKRNNYDNSLGSNYSLKQHAYGDNYGQDADFEIMANGQDGKNFRQSIMQAAADTKRTVSNAPTFVKGLLAGGIVLTTLCMLFRGKKVSSKMSEFWDKVNPKNWFNKS